MQHLDDRSDDPWSLYWQADHGESCISTSGADYEVLAAFWRAFAARLPPAARVLDLATGNGAVPRHLLQGNPRLRITGVDQADIDPLRFLRDPGDLARVSFRAREDLCELSFEAASFDALTSQFGIEYAPPERAAASVARMMCRGAVFAFLMHHADSDVVRPNVGKLREIDALLAAEGPLECLHRYLQGTLPIAALEQAGRRYLEGAGERSKAISGQIYAGINRVIAGQRTDPGRARALAAGMSERLIAERGRLQQLAGAASSAGEIEAFRALLSASGLRVERPRVLEVGEPGARAIVGWQLTGCRA